MSRRGLIAGLCVAIVVLLIIWAVVRGRARNGQDKERETTAKSAPQISRTDEGDPLLKVDTAAQARAAIRTVVLQPQTLQPEAVAYGHLEEDASHSFVLRAPFAGILHAGQGGSWPALGDRLAAGAAIGTIEPRFDPSERISLTSQLATARAELNASRAAAATARAAYERARILNADNKNVSDRALQEAESHLKEQEERLKAAADNTQLLEASLRAAGPGGSRPLIVERGGDVVEVVAQPSEAIEAGAPIVRVARLDRLLARVELPAGQRASPDVRSARIIAAGYEDQPIPATRVALGPAADPKTQGQPFFFRLTQARFGLRPNHAVTAYLSLPGAPRPGVVIPRDALVRVGGKAYAYVQTSPDQFARKEVPLDEPVAGGFFTSARFKPGDKVVVQGAQILLSEELKSQIAGPKTE